MNPTIPECGKTGLFNIKFWANQESRWYKKGKYNTLWALVFPVVNQFVQSANCFCKFNFFIYRSFLQTLLFWNNVTDQVKWPQRVDSPLALPTSLHTVLRNKAVLDYKYALQEISMILSGGKHPNGKKVHQKCISQMALCQENFKEWKGVVWIYNVVCFFCCSSSLTVLWLEPLRYHCTSNSL